MRHIWVIEQEYNVLGGAAFQPGRVLPDIQDGWNREGLIGQNDTKKKAFYVLKKFYDEMELKYK